MKSQVFIALATLLSITSSSVVFGQAASNAAVGMSGGSTIKEKPLIPRSRVSTKASTHMSTHDTKHHTYVPAGNAAGTVVAPTQ
jgi:hypothetical protein